MLHASFRACNYLFAFSMSRCAGGFQGQRWALLLLRWGEQWQTRRRRCDDDEGHAEPFESFKRGIPRGDCYGRG